jgi:protein-S-isoprenylcysteine O-methyltransferase Ste14
MSEEAIWHIFVVAPWGIFLAYWIVGSIKTRANAQKEPFFSRLAFLLAEIFGYLLIFVPINIGPLRFHVIPRTIPGAILGVAGTWVGIGLAIWARYHLAEYWSARITIKEGHQLIRTGPYRRLRHPIYTGLILATTGSALVIDHWRCVLGVCLITVGYCFKAKREEAMLEKQFGEAFREHRKRTGFLFPKFL